MGCHDGRIQSVHSPLAGVLQCCLPHLRHDAQTCTELKHNQNSVHDLNTYACQNACHFACTWHVMLLAVQLLAVTLLQCTRTHRNCRARIALLHSNRIHSIPISIVPFVTHVHAKSVGTSLPKHLMHNMCYMYYVPSKRANALSQGRTLALAGMLMYAGNQYGVPCLIGQSQLIYLFMPYALTYIYTYIYIYIYIYICIYALNTYMPAGDGIVSHQRCWPGTCHPKCPEHHS